MRVSFVLNQRTVNYEIEPGDYLLDTLRENHITSVKKACDGSTCGVCTVLMNGKPILACTLLTVRVEGQHIITVEGIYDEVEKISHYFGVEGADQCGFCNPSMALTVYALKKEKKNASEEEIKAYLVGNLCRCTGYVAQHDAIRKYLGDES
jgi:aerobic carbon-monoxide dehydrogenase small subunit